MTEKIFIVDDSEDIRRSLTLIFQSAGYEVMTLDNGHEALKQVTQFMPDLILLDIVMPHMDGYQVCQNLKNHSQTKDIPIIFLSAKTDATHKIKGLQIGGTDYVTKPFDRREVMVRVRNQLEIQRLTRALTETNRQLTEKQRKLDEDLRAAAGIQQNLLPQQRPAIENLDISWKFIPSYMIGGDIFNFLRLDEDHIGFYIADVSGHGVPSALVAVSLSQALQLHTGYIKRIALDRSSRYEIVSPKEVLNTLDTEYPLKRFDQFFTIIYTIINIRNGQLTYSNAAHPPPVLLRAQGDFELLDKGGTLIGMDGILPFEEDQKELREGDKLIFYTDGVAEIQNAWGEFFGQDRFHSLLTNSKHDPIEKILDDLLTSMNGFAGDEVFHDDITLVGIEFEGPHSQSR